MGTASLSPGPGRTSATGSASVFPRLVDNRKTTRPAFRGALIVEVSARFAERTNPAAFFASFVRTLNTTPLLFLLFAPLDLTAFFRHKRLVTVDVGEQASQPSRDFVPVEPLLCGELDDIVQ